MAQVTLDAPLTLDPKQATKLVLRRADIDFTARTVEIDYVLVDATGKTIDRKRITASGAQVQTWINNQETTIYGRLLAALGVTGTIG
jgi:hypothetical protein